MERTGCHRFDSGQVSDVNGGVRLLIKKKTKEKKNDTQATGTDAETDSVT